MVPASTLKTSQRGRDFIARYEDDKLEAYPDPKTGSEPWTIGKGHTGGVKPGDKISQEESDMLFEDDIRNKGEMFVQRYVTVPVTQGMFDALVSIVFNVGPGHSKKDGIILLKSGQPSTLLRKLNAGDYDGAKAEFPKWCSPGTNVENGLRKRRNAEVDELWTSLD